MDLETDAHMSLATWGLQIDEAADTEWLMTELTDDY
jgi:hypothetical protein